MHSLLTTCRGEPSRDERATPTIEPLLQPYQRTLVVHSLLTPLRSVETPSRSCQIQKFFLHASSRCEKSLRMSSLAEFFTKNAKGKTQLSKPFFDTFSANKIAKTPRNARFLGADHIGRETNLFSRRERGFSYSRFPANVPNLLGCNSVSVAWEHCGFANIFSAGDLHCQPFKSYRPS